MKRCVLAALAVLVLALPATAHAQTLDLDTHSEPPALDRHTFAADLISQLQREIAELPSPESIADPADRAITQALISYRIMAADLLAIGDRDQQAGSIAVVSGFRLTRGRADLQRVLERLRTLDRDGDDTQTYERALFAIRMFSEKVAEQADALRAARGEALAARLSRIFAPLADAVAALEAAPVADHWVRLPPGEAPPDASDPASVPTAIALETLRRRLVQSPLDDETRDAITAIIGFLERGSAFSEWRPLVRQYRRLLDRVVSLAEALTAADWLSPEARDEYSLRIREAVTRFRDPRTRDHGLAQLEALRRSKDVIERITTLETLRVKLRDLDAVRTVLDRPGADGLPPRPADLETFVRVLDRMIEFRVLRDDDVDLQRELRIAHRELIKAYDNAERALLDELANLAAGTTDGLTDPAFSSLLADQRQYLADLRRVRRIPSWMEAAAAMHPDVAELFAADLRRLSRSLLDSNRRPEAIRTLERLEDQLERFFPMPFEPELRAATAAAVVATGGMHEQLAKEIDAARRTWIDAWTEGEPARGESRVELLYRLCRMMADTAPIVAREGDATLLNRWSMWELPGGIVARPMSDLPARLKLSTASAIDGDDAGLERQLDQLERDAPLTRLAGRLLAALEPTLEQLPSGAPSLIGQTVHPPAPEAWLADRREDLANLCRYTMEMEYARVSGRNDLAEQLREYVHALAEEILADLESSEANSH